MHETMHEHEILGDISNGASRMVEAANGIALCTEYCLYVYSFKIVIRFEKICMASM